MAIVRSGERIGRLGAIRLGCSATLFDAPQTKLLLTRRTDNGQWCLPGGAMEAGECATETCEREVYEETGLQVKVTTLLGVYSSPHRLVEYADGHRWQIVALHFVVEMIGGTLRVSDETTAYGFFSHDEIAALDVMIHHHERIADSFAIQRAPYLR